MNTTNFRTFLGINNRLPDTALTTKEGRWLRAAENTDIDNAGKLRRRKATALIQPMTAPHSLFEASTGERYAVINSVLYKVTLPDYSQELIKVLTSDARVHYAEYNGAVFYSNGVDAGRVTGAEWRPWGLPLPGTPMVSEINGTLPEGQYQVAVSFYNEDTGEEGGVGPSNNFTIGTGGLRVSLPALAIGSTHVRIYVSTVNGSAPMLYATSPDGGTTFDVMDKNLLAQGKDALQRYESPIPPGRPFVHRGILYTTKEENVYEGIPFRPGYYRAASNSDDLGGRVPFPERVTNFVPAANGIYVVADKTYWFGGPSLTQTEDVKVVLPFGGVLATEFEVPYAALVGWFSPNGFVLGNQTGEAETPMMGAVDLVPPVTGATGVFGYDGYYRAVSCGWCLNIERMAATSYTGYDFSSISGRYATGEQGFYDLSPDVGAVDAVVAFGKMNFGNEQLKHVPACYIDGKSTTAARLKVRLPGGVEYSYDTRAMDEDTQVRRIDLGRGLRASHYEFFLYNTEGSDFEWNSVGFVDAKGNRKI